MEKLKKFYYENRVFAILMIVAIVCIVLMLILSLNYFFMGINKSKYGNRLNLIEDISVSKKEQKEIVEMLESSEIIKSANIDIAGRIIYIHIECNESATLVDSEGQAVLALDLISDEVKNVYDIHFTLNKDSKDEVDAFTIMGAKNKSNVNIIWNNNTPIPEKEENPNIDDES